MEILDVRASLALCGIGVMVRAWSEVTIERGKERCGVETAGGKSLKPSENTE